MQPGGEALKFLPLRENPVAVGGVPFDQIADRQDKLRLQEVDLFDRPRKNLLAMPAGPIANDDELKVVGRVIELEVAPRVAIFRLDAEIGIGSRSGLRCRLRESDCDDEDNSRDGGDEELLHWCKPLKGIFEEISRREVMATSWIPEFTPISHAGVASNDRLGSAQAIDRGADNAACVARSFPDRIESADRRFPRIVTANDPHGRTAARLRTDQHGVAKESASPGAVHFRQRGTQRFRDERRQDIVQVGRHPPRG